MSTNPEVKKMEEQEHKKASADLLALYKDVAKGLDSLTDIAQEYKLKAEKAWQDLDEARQELIDTKIELEKLQLTFTTYMDVAEATEKKLRGQVTTLENFARQQRDELTQKDKDINTLDNKLAGKRLYIGRLEALLATAEQDLEGFKLEAQRKES